MSAFTQLIESDQLVLVDFSAEWCGPCNTLAPILKETATKLAGRAKIIKVDIDKNPAAAQKFGIRSVPTLLLFRKGEIKWRQSGVLPANALLETILKFL